jgi:hypothetical protein
MNLFKYCLSTEFFVLTKYYGYVIQLYVKIIIIKKHKHAADM